MRDILIMGIGGFVGTVMRYGVHRLLSRLLTSPFPIGTFVANITGCLLIGILYGAIGKWGWLNNEWRLLLITGFCGAYTTFSTFSHESVQLFTRGEYGYFSIYVLTSLALGFVATFGGMMLMRH